MTDKYVGSNALAEVWSKIKANFGRSIGVSTTTTTVSLQLKNASGENLGSAATFPAATTTAAGALSADDKSKLNGITSGAQPNQNAFSNITIGSTNIQADAVSDTLTFVAGANVALTPDATNDQITIAATDTTYSDVVAGSATSGLMTGSDKTKLNGIATGAEVNQNAFSKIKSGTTTIEADAKEDTLEIVAGNLITITPDATEDKITIATTATNNVGTITGITTTSPLSGSGTSGSVALSHATSGVTAASKGDTTNQTPGFGGTFKALSGTVNATGHLTAFSEHTVTIPSIEASTTAAGLMSSDDKTKLNGIAEGAEVNQNAFSNVKVGNTTVAADTKQDTLELYAGSNITLTPDDTNDKITIAATDTTYSDVVAGGASGLMSGADKTKLNGIATGAEVNQNAFSNVKVGSTTVAADAKTDTLELVAGSNVTLTPDATNDKVTIAATDTTYSDATTSAHGLMTAADKTKLNGIDSGANFGFFELDNGDGESFTATDSNGSITIEPASATSAMTVSAMSGIVLLDVKSATASQQGSMSAAHYSKLEGIEANATKSLKSKLYTAKCTTATSTAAKVATLDDSTDFALAAGVMVAVQFQYGNSAASPTLNVNSTGAKNIAIPSGATTSTINNGTTYNSWGAYETLIFTYDGSLWVHMGSGYLQQMAYKLAAAAAPKASPELTGTPTAPTAAVGTNTTQIATTAFVIAEIASEISQITGIDFQIVESLPASGVKGTIYLISNNGSGSNVYDEYIWITSGSTGSFEKIGTTDIDLSGYATITQLNAKQDAMLELTAAEVDAICV